MTALSQQRLLTIKELANHSGLSTSQVSSGRKQGRYRGWVSSTQGEVLGKGRPKHLWELSVSPLELIRELESEATTKQVILSNAVKRLRSELSKK